MKNRKQHLKALTLIFLSIFSYSCSSKKIAVSKDITEEKIDSTYVEKKDSTAFVQNGISVIENFLEIQIEPVDISKPIIVDGVKYENASLKIKKAEKSIVDTTKTIVSETVEKEVELEKETTEKKFDKDVDKKSSNSLYIWLLAVLVILYLVYKLRRLLPNPYSIIRYICQTLKNQIK